MLELGKAGGAGYRKGELPVLRDGSPVAVLRAANWKEEATAVVGDREWVFAKRKGELTGRWAAEPEDVARLRARQASFWKGTWTVDLEGRPVEVQNASMWKGTHRYLTGGQRIAESGSTGGWSPRPTLDADGSLPLHQQVFLLWLELVLSRRNTAAVGAATGAAVIGGSS
ncbi:hypothetical protein [Blastococcus sp. CT_GayMR16]|uniref:hypothetical protein n=1 Tax=Blastococcus sp. CT_GayMR16 TaxID=2559607 RepID=UPI0010747513|nr:hypothetical protein [Blastococcus sp. CT_GayMR16]TFV91221.1 hypothetical protein E4P38_01040 [Blastococcus sp. CT_GayMR16]